MSADIYSNEFLKMELEKFKSLYEHEKEQMEEFQRYSKELETEMDMELNLCKNKLKEMDRRNEKLKNELEDLKNRYESERQSFVSTENVLRAQLIASEESCNELKQKLRKVEQLNDDLERRERIQVQELVDWAARYEKCLERCAYLEAGLVSNEMGDVDVISNVYPNENSNFIYDYERDKSTISTLSKVPNGQNRSFCDRQQLILSNPHTKNSHMDYSPSKGSRIVCNGSGTFIPPSTSNFPEGTKEKRSSSEIVSNLFKKIEEVEKQVDPNKYIIHRTPKHRN